MSKPKLLDLYCCQGGAAKGYTDAGFEVVGVDIDPQPRYPYEFHQGDALAFGAEHGHKFDVIHASPPCQAFTNAQKIQGRTHANLIDPTRELLDSIGVPYVIENVPGSPLRDDLTLCGAMFGLGTYRHRVFELGGFQVDQSDHPPHVARTAKMGRPAKPGEYMHVVGNFSGVSRARQVMGMPWANRDGLREAIPPAYAEYIGRQLLDHITARPRRQEAA